MISTTPPEAPAQLWQEPDAWDATRLSSLMSCKRRFYYGHVKQLRPSANAGFSIDLEFGTAWHESLRTFDSATCAGHPPQKALIEAIKRALELTAEWPEAQVSPAKNRTSLIRALVWYVEQFGDGVLKPLLVDGKPALEVSWKFPLFPDTPRPLLCGNMDGIVEFGGEVWVLERKTTGSALSSFYWAKYAPNLQVDLYCLAARTLWPEMNIKGVILEAMQTGAGFARFERRLFLRTPFQMGETLEAVRHAVSEARGDPEELEARPNFASCMNPGPCPFRAVCMSGSRQIRQWTLDTQYAPREKPWNPLAADDSRDT